MMMKLFATVIAAQLALTAKAKANGTATARFLTPKFVIEVIYTLEDGEVVDTFGKVWRR